MPTPVKACAGWLDPTGFSCDVLTGDPDTDTAAIQWAIDQALVGPVTSTRYGKYRVSVPAASWQINQPLRIWSAGYFTLMGDGNETELRPMADMDSVLDIDGLGHSKIGDLRIEGRATGPFVTKPVSYQWTPAVARSTTGNVMERIRVSNTRCVVACGIADAPASDARQVDYTRWVDCVFDGMLPPGDLYNPTAGVYEAGVRIGRPGSPQGNVIGHHFYNVATFGSVAGYEINNGNTVGIFSPRADVCQTVLKTAGGFNVSMRDARFEHSGRLLEHLGGSFPAMVGLSNIWFDNSHGAVPDGMVVDWRGAGRLSLDTCFFGHGDGVAPLPVISTNTAQPHSIHLSGVAAPHPTAGPGPCGFVRPLGTSPTTLTTAGYIGTDPSDSTIVSVAP